jgi:orotate phosphoribosyltransferase-like protein
MVWGPKTVKVIVPVMIGVMLPDANVELIEVLAIATPGAPVAGLEAMIVGANFTTNVPVPDAVALVVAVQSELLYSVAVTVKV